MDLAGRLAQLEEIVRDAKSMPLSSSVLISRDEVLEMLARDAGGHFPRRSSRRAGS